MKNNMSSQLVLLLAILALLNSCKNLNVISRSENKSVPSTYKTNKSDTLNSAKVQWKSFYKDPYLVALIDSALSHNQELNILIEEINISNNEVKARRGAYLPFLFGGAGSGVDKVGRYTSQGASDASNEILPGKPVPEALPNFVLGVSMSWEIDVWHKLRNARKAALYKYLSTIEGKNFMVTNLISEIANSYYELIALDNQLEILKSNIEIQKNALEIVKLQKIAAKVTELAVKKFEAEVLKNQSHVNYIIQQITVIENRINFLVGRFPQPVARNSIGLIDFPITEIQSGIPSQLLQNRTDIRKAENELMASKLDVQVARAEFFPSFMITSGVGFNAFNPKFLLKTTESMLINLAGDMIAPLINRNALKANFYSANSKQIQSIFNYERSILNAYIEVYNGISNLENLKKSFDIKQDQVKALVESVDISTTLFKSARADYMEVLMTQRDALDSKFELIEIKKQQLNGIVDLYKALGGGWQ
jgi:multidrug efflux system outer membrane protein